MSQGRSRWNERYKQRPDKLFMPEAYLVQNSHLFQEGSVLDVACGDGRNAMYLARQGNDVTGIDFSVQALTRLQRFASESNVMLHTKVLDVDTPEQISNLGLFDHAIIIHFKPSIETFLAVSHVIRPNGILLMTSFNREHLAASPQFPQSFCYEEGEFLHRTPVLDLVQYVSYADDRANLDGYIFRKRPSGSVKHPPYQGLVQY